MGVSVDISVEGGEEILQKLNDLPQKAKAQVAQAINEIIERARKIAIRNLTVKNALNTGRLRASVRVSGRATPEDLNAALSAGSTDGRTDYAVEIEFGTKPHFPPVEAVTDTVEPLDRWVETKLGIKDDEERKGVALAIAKKINRVGTKEQPYMRPARNQAQALFTRIVPKLLRSLNL